MDDAVLLINYSSEDNRPALYADVNEKAHDKDRRKIMNYLYGGDGEGHAQG